MSGASAREIAKFEEEKKGFFTAVWVDTGKNNVWFVISWKVSLQADCMVAGPESWSHWSVEYMSSGTTKYAR